MQTNLRQAIIISIMALSLIVTPKAYSQKAPVNESQLKKQANNYFEDEDYANAYLQYSQLLSLYPQDPNYNYRFGACMLFSQADKKKPIDYIETAVKQSTVENLAYFYLGRAYHLNYRFDDAIRAYQHFKQNASGSDLKKHPVDRLIEMCNNGKQLLGNLHDLDVLRKKELGSADYYQAYDLSENGGTLLTEPDDFKTKTDKKKNLTSIIYLSPDRKKLFFASYGDDDKNGKDIYVAYKLPNGAWGKPSNLGTIINTPYDEDYPFYDAPTQTLYFCSMGHNSMGGYDIFKSTYNETNNSWSQPVNMDFPINTPGDDILFIADTMNETAFFSSTRSSPNGKIAVYKINVQPHPPEYIVVKGISYNDAGTATTASRITVKDYQTNETIGVFNSSADNGSYVLNLLNGGHFTFTVETGNHKTQSESVTLPMQNGLTPIQQQISYEASSDRLIIRNITNGAVSDSNYLLALDMIQKRADMDVNVDTTAPRKPIVKQSNNPVTLNNPDNKSTVQSGDTAGADTASDIAIDSTGKTGVSNNQLIQIAKADAKQQQDDANSQKDDANRAIQYASNKLTESINISKHAGEIAARADMLTDQKQRNDTLNLALQLKQQAQDIQKKAVEAFQYASQLEIQAEVKQKEADQATQYTTKLDSALKSPNKEKSIKKLQTQRDSLQKQDVLNAPTSPTAADLIRIQAQNARQDSIEVVKHNEDLQKEADRLQKESDDYVSEAQKTKDPNEKLALLEQARDLTASKKEKENEIQDNQKTLTDLHNQYNDLQYQSKQIDDLVKNNPSALQINETDASSIKSDIKNYTPPVQTNPIHSDTTHTNTVIVGQPGVPLSQAHVPDSAFAYLGQQHDTTSKHNTTQNPVQTNPVNSDNTQHTQSTNPVVISNSTQNPVQTNPTHPDTAQHTQITNPVVINNTTQNPVQTNPTHSDTTQHTQVTNPVVINNSTQNPAQTNPTHSDTTKHTQLTNPVVINSTIQNPVQNNPTHSDTTQHTQATNPVVINNTTQNPVQTNPTHSDTTQHTQTTNPVVINNTIQNPVQVNPIHSDTTQHTQATNPIVINNTTQNPVQTNPTHFDTTQHTQVTNPVVVNNPTQNQAQTSPVQTDTIQHNNTVATNNPVQNSTSENPNVPVIKYSSTQASISDKNAGNFTKESTQLTTQAEDIRTQAKQSTDPAQTKILMKRADSLDDAASEDKIVSSIYKNEADGTQYLTNQQQLSAWQTVMKNSSNDKAATAQLLTVDANGYYDQSVREKQKADSTTVPYLKQIHLTNAEQYLETAINKQQQAHDIFLQVNPDLKNVTPQSVAATNTQVNNPDATQTQVATNHTQNNSEAVATNNQTQSNPTHTVTNSTPTTTQTNPVTVNQPTHTNNTQSGSDTTHNNSQSSTSVAVNNPSTNHSQNGNHSTPTNPADTVDASQRANPVNINPRIHHDDQATSQPENNTTASTSVVIDEIKQLPKSPYSKANPIPMNPPLPEGLVFKVQIGAFRNQIPQNAFRGLEPISGEVVGNGLTRYTAGVFKEFNKAKGAQTKVRGIGYRDAFIVAFYNGKRISIKEAASIQSGNQPSVTNTTASAEPQHNNTTTQPQTNTNPETTNTTQPQTNNPVVSTPVTDVKGIFYTVQVGAFKTTVPASKLYNLSPLFSYNASNGYIRYNCGIYSNVPNASSAKDAIVGKTPIKDAFVVAYYNGERITLPQAAQMLANGTAVISKNPKLDAVPVGANNAATRTDNTLTQPTNNLPANATHPADTGNDKVTFSVQVGAYSGQIPVSVANNLLKIANQGITTHKEADGTTSYTVGSYGDYTSSNMLKGELVQDGFPGCFVVAYHKGKKISLKEAQTLINK